MLRFVAVLVISAAWAHGQSCCGGTGTFLGGMERAGLGTGTLTAAAVYNYTAMERTLNGAARVPNPNGSIAYAHALNVELEFAPVERWSFLVVLPFSDKVRTINVATGNTTLYQRYHAAGTSDMFGIIKYALVPASALSPWSLAVGGGVKAPTGDYRIEENGVEQPIDVQPGTSSWDLLGWALGCYRLDEPSAMVSLSALLRKPGPNINGRTLGTDLQALLALTLTELDMPVVPILLSRWRWTAPDRQDGRIIASTGTFRIELLPAVALTAWEPLVVRIGAQLPLYERTNGIQLAPSWGAFAELRSTFSLW